MVRTRLTMLLALVAVAAIALPAGAAPITWNLTGSGSSGSQGNVRVLSQGGITLEVTGWGYTYSTSNNALEKAALGQWPAGLGVCNASEGFSCGSPSHQVDNSGADDWVLFLFSTPVDFDGVTVDPYGTYDRDVSYYVGNVSSPLDLTGMTYANLAGLGFSSRYDSPGTVSANPRTVSILGGTGNALLFGAMTGGEADGYYDYFKITALTTTTTVPEPGSTLMLLGMGVAGIIFRSRRRS